MSACYLFRRVLCRCFPQQRIIPPALADDYEQFALRRFFVPGRSLLVTSHIVTLSLVVVTVVRDGIGYGNEDAARIPAAMFDAMDVFSNVIFFASLAVSTICLALEWFVPAMGRRYWRAVFAAHLVSILAPMAVFASTWDIHAHCVLGTSEDWGKDCRKFLPWHKNITIVSAAASKVIATQADVAGQFIRVSHLKDLNLFVIGTLFATAVVGASPLTSAAVTFAVGCSQCLAYVIYADGPLTANEMLVPNTVFFFLGKFTVLAVLFVPLITIPITNAVKDTFLELAELAAEFNHLRVPKVLARLVCVGSKIGAGGSGQIFAGTYSGHAVAIKECFSGIIDSTAVKELEEECATLASLRHPGILHIFGVCEMEWQGVPRVFLVEERLAMGLNDILVAARKWDCHRPRKKLTGTEDSARTSTAARTTVAPGVQQQQEGLLTERQELGKWWSPRRCLDVATQIASAMQYLHSSEHGTIVHLDLKPENIMLSKNPATLQKSGHDGRVDIRIVDFGTARLVKDDERRSARIKGAPLSDHELAGTPHYMPPEFLQLLVREKEEHQARAMDEKEGCYTAAMMADHFKTFYNKMIDEAVPSNGSRLLCAWDVYSFGTMLGEMLTLQRPYPPSEYPTMEAIAAAVISGKRQDLTRFSFSSSTESSSQRMDDQHGGDNFYKPGDLLLLPSELGKIASDCWSESVRERPDFAAVVARLSQLKTGSQPGVNLRGLGAFS